jgi:hypothetical protein
MQLPPILQPDSRARLIQGAIAGALATVIIGFGFAGWTLGSTAAEMSAKNANNAVVAALAPICVSRFTQGSEAAAKLVALKATDSWKQDTFVAKGGWATFPGDKEPNRDVAEACARILAAQS